MIDEWFGEVICVSSLEELSQHESAILADGLIQRGTLVQRARHYDGLPFVGEGGLKRQLEAKLARFAEIEAAIRRLEPIEREIERIIEARRKEIEDHVSTSQELVRIEALPRLNAEHEALMEKIQAIDSESFGALEDEAQAKKEQLQALKSEELTIARKGGGKEIEQAERLLAARKEEASRREDEFSRTKLAIDIVAHLQRYRAWKEDMSERYPAADVQARKFAEAASANKAFLPRAELAAPRLAELLALDDAGFRKLFSGSPVKRIGRGRFVRNCLYAAGNSGDAGLLGPVRALLGDPDPVVAEAAQWALGKLADDSAWPLRRRQILSPASAP